MGRTRSTTSHRTRLAPTSVVGSPCILSFLNLPDNIGFCRGSLRGTLVSGLRRFLLRLKHNFSFISHRCHFGASGRGCCISLMFCGFVLGYFILVSLGIKGLACRSVKRVSFCAHCFRRGVHARASGPAVNVILYARQSGAVIGCSMVGSDGRLFTSGCGLCLPARRRLVGRLRADQGRVRGGIGWHRPNIVHGRPVKVGGLG